MWGWHALEAQVPSSPVRRNGFTAGNEHGMTGTGRGRVARQWWQEQMHGTAKGGVACTYAHAKVDHA